MSYFVETNVFLRFLTRDEEVQYQACKKLFQSAEDGEIRLVTSALVIFEIILTLLSYYRETKEEIINKIIALLEFSGLEVEDKEVFLEALVLWQQKNVDFNDVYNFVWAREREVAAIYSYDKHFDRFKQILRVEP